METEIQLARKLNESEIRGYGNIKRVLHTATIMWQGWERDNRAWIVEFQDGTTGALITCGGLRRWSREHAEEKLAETEASAASIRRALELWPMNQETEG